MPSIFVGLPGDENIYILITAYVRFPRTTRVKIM
jgi:hypothetical protein